MLIAIIPLLAAIIGVLVYALAQNAKLVEVGRALLWCGLLVTLFVAAHETVSL
jgi:hypothetical protein